VAEFECGILRSAHEKPYVRILLCDMLTLSITMA
jgi:hypothetical protein